ncbi:MAG: hypothetical protein N2596_00135 [Syntrophorhabdaceae bacterium]|nr:hypothetical protein [Syntrophorhabdaceae bacterium]
MDKKEKNRGLFSLLIILQVFFLILQNNPSNADEPWGIQIEREDGTDGLRRCKICGRILNIGHIHMDAEGIVKNHLKNNLTDMNIPFIENKGTGRYIHILLYRFIERKGGNLAVDRPASVGFHIHLFDKDNILKRVYVFEETQQALSENVLSIGKFLRRRARWITASELAEEGIYNGLLILQEELK